MNHDIVAAIVELFRPDIQDMIVEKLSRGATQCPNHAAPLSRLCLISKQWLYPARKAPYHTAYISGYNQYKHFVKNLSFPALDMAGEINNRTSDLPVVDATFLPLRFAATMTEKDDAKDVIFIGELNIKAVIHSPIPYVCPPVPFHLLRARSTPLYQSKYVPVRLLRDAESKGHTIHIMAPLFEDANGDISGGEAFGRIPQPVANVIGPMLAKILIRLNASVERGRSSNVRFPCPGLECCALFFYRLLI